MDSMTDTEPKAGWTEILGEHASNPSSPRTSGDTIHAFDTAYKVASCEQRIKAQFEQFIRAESRKASRQATMDGDPSFAQELNAAYIAAYAAGDFNWGGRVFRQYITGGSSISGTMYLFYLLLKRCQPDMTEELAARIFAESPEESGMAMAWALGNSESPEKRKAPGTNGTMDLETLDGPPRQPS